MGRSGGVEESGDLGRRKAIDFAQVCAREKEERERGRVGSRGVMARL